MASMIQFTLFALLVAQISFAAVAPVVFDSKLIVEDVTKCPVKNVLWDTADFDAAQLIDLPTVLQDSGVSQACQDAAIEDLSVCYLESEPNSLQIMTGCCSKACAAGIKKSVDGGCFKQYTDALCNDPETANLRTGLFATGKRCINFEGSCQAATPPAGSKATNVTAKATNATAANRTAITDADTPSTTPAGAPAAAAAAAAAAPPRSSAVGIAGSTVVSFLLAAVALVAAML